MIEKGKFIVLEGQGFCGKTEQCALLVKDLKERDIEVIETQEPGGVQSAVAIRAELLDRRARGTITPEEEVELFYKSRGRFLAELVIPALEKGVWIVSTRFSPSTEVYQGIEGGVNLDLIRQKEQEIVGKNQPDLYILLDVDPEIVYKRMQTSSREKHGYNEMDMEKLIKRAAAYRQIAQENRYYNWAVVDGNLSISEVYSKIWDLLKSKFHL